MSPKPSLLPALHPFFGARLGSALLDSKRDTDMSIVFLQGGGLSKDQIDRVPLQPRPFLSSLAGWGRALVRGLVGKD